MKKIRFFGLLALLLSCGEELMEKPEGLIPKEKMILILKDMTVINAAKSANMSKFYDHDVEPTSLVFEQHGIDSLQFVISDRYYASLPVVYEAMYKEIEQLLETEKNALSEAKKIKDSINAHKGTSKPRAASQLRSEEAL